MDGKEIRKNIEHRTSNFERRSAARLRLLPFKVRRWTLDVRCSHLIPLLLAALPALAVGADVPKLTHDQIITEADKVAEAQLAAIGDQAAIDWTWGVMEVGYAEFSHVSAKGDLYTVALTTRAERQKWTPLLHPTTPFHADDFCIGQTFLDLYADHPDPVHMTPLKARLDALVDNLNGPANPARPTFYWCDALFMAPPVLAHMSAITGDKKYIDAMDKEYWRTAALLYDNDEHLFYRDAKYLKQLDPNGKKIFWSRGNGWVMGGLALVLQQMPKDYPTRPKYEAMFKDMSAKLLTLQAPDGTWPASLIDAPLFPGPETSGTSLFTFALTWGINNNLLERATYLPVVTKSWHAMLATRRPDGLPGYSQAPGAAPAQAKPDGTQVYSTGALLLSATELQKLVK